MIVTADGREFVRTGNDDRGIVAYVKIGHFCKDGVDKADVDAVVADNEFAKAGKR